MLFKCFEEIVTEKICQTKKQTRKQLYLIGVDFFFKSSPDFLQRACIICIIKISVDICFNLNFGPNYFPQREVAANSQNGEEIVPVLTLRFLITQLEAALRNVQATNYTVSVFF